MSALSTHEAYRKAPGLNFSLAKFLLKSQAHFMRALEEDQQKPKPCFELGSCVHANVLEDKDPTGLWAIKPADMTFSTKEGKAWRAERLAEGREIVTQDFVDAYVGVTGALKASYLGTILKALKSREHVMRFTVDGVPCKALIDAFGFGYMLDLKTTADASPAGFGKSVANFDYLLQAAWYLEAVQRCHPEKEVTRFIWAAVETEPPYCVAFYELEPKDLALGQEMMHLALSRYKDLARRGFKDPKGWPTVGKLQIPSWYRSQPLPRV